MQRIVIHTSRGAPRIFSWGGPEQKFSRINMVGEKGWYDMVGSQKHSVLNIVGRLFAYLGNGIRKNDNKIHRS